MYLASESEVREESKHQDCQRDHHKPMEGGGQTRGKTHGGKDGGIQGYRAGYPGSEWTCNLETRHPGLVGIRIIDMHH